VSTTPDPTPKVPPSRLVPPEPKRGPKILAMDLSTGQQIHCEQTINVEWEKDAGMGAEFAGKVTIGCSCAHHRANPDQLPAPQTAIDMLPNGPAQFTLSHPMGTNEDNVEVKATITMIVGGAAHSMVRTVHIRCDMPGAPAQDTKQDVDEKESDTKLAADEHEAAANEASLKVMEPVTLDPSVQVPIRLVPKRDKVLLGLFQARAGDTVSVTIQEVEDDGDRVIATLLATVRDGPTRRLKRWTATIPGCLVQKCDSWLTIRLDLRKAGRIVFTRTFHTLILCSPD
jgi:hypothetical protein